MFFLNDVNIEFRKGRKRGSKNKIKYDYIKEGRRITSTGVNISKEIRGWGSFLNRLKNNELIKQIKQLKSKKE